MEKGPLHFHVCCWRQLRASLPIETCMRSRLEGLLSVPTRGGQAKTVLLTVLITCLPSQTTPTLTAAVRTRSETIHVFTAQA